MKVEGENRKSVSKKLKAKSEVQNESKVKAVEVASTVEAEPSVDSFDFGGLPERNLKRNLGCG